MRKVINFVDVSTEGLESSPVADALAGLRANEARYYKNKYDRDFAVAPAADEPETLAYVTSVLAEERDIVIASPPLEVTMFEVDDLRMAYVFYQSGLAINVMYGLEPGGKCIGYRIRGHGVPEELETRFQVRATEVEARGRHPRLVLRHQGRVLTQACAPR